MIFEGESDRLNPDNFTEEDSCRTRCDLTDLTRIMLRSIRAMNAVEKQSVRDALDEKMDRQNRFTVEDVLFLRSIGSNIE